VGKIRKVNASELMATPALFRGNGPCSFSAVLATIRTLTVADEIGMNHGVVRQILFRLCKVAVSVSPSGMLQRSFVSQSRWQPHFNAAQASLTVFATLRDLPL
jgi:hypothetical protein